nr:MAG TPA: leucine-rich repeat protein [Caudoviricetes sp.]
MAKTDNLTDFLTGVANAIRTRKGTTAKINPQNFETEIGSITTSKPEQEKTAALSMSSGNQIISPDDGKVLSKVTITKPTTLTPGNIRKDTNIGGVVGTLEEAKPEQEKTAKATNSKQIISPDSGKTLSSVIVEAAPLPDVNNNIYKNTNKCLINSKNKTLVLGCNNSVIPSDGSVTSIGDGAFSNCSGLKSVTIPDSVTSIGSLAFYSCNGFTSLIIPDSVTSIGPDAFNYCTGLINVTIGNGVTSIGNSAFSWCGYLTNVTIGNSVTSIGNSAFAACDEITSITIPDSVTSIGNSAFMSCSGLTSLTIGNGVTSIGENVFKGCRGLTSITIPDSVKSIGHEAFSGCSGLTSVTIPNSVTSIGHSAFLYCTGLINVTIGNGVTSINDQAFNDCSGLTSVTMLPTTPPTLGWRAIPSNVTTITVPVGCGDAYKTAARWSAYADKIVEATA